MVDLGCHKRPLAVDLSSRTLSASHILRWLLNTGVRTDRRKGCCPQEGAAPHHYIVATRSAGRTARKRCSAIKALNRAVRTRGPQPGLIFHTARIVCVRRWCIQEPFAGLRIIESMNRPDNAYVEWFFHSINLGTLLTGTW